MTECPYYSDVNYDEVVCKNTKKIILIGVIND